MILFYLRLCKLRFKKLVFGKCFSSTILVLSSVRIAGENETAERIAHDEGFDIVDKISSRLNLYHFQHPHYPRRSKYKNSRLINSVRHYKEVVWVEQVSVKWRDVNRLQCAGPVQRTSNYKNLIKRGYFNQEWYLHDCRKTNLVNRFDINVISVWYKYHIFGYGITVMIIDDGVETKHRDLRDNYDKYFGIDLIDNDDEPDPISSFFNDYSHGTYCAGVIAMKASNKVCGDGIAPLANLGAVRLFGRGPSNNLLEYQALTFRIDEVHITNNSWGPTKNGKSLDISSTASLAGLEEGIIWGRGGRGTIHLFTAGNSKEKGDTCAHNAFANSIYTLVIAGVKHDGTITNYSERCANIIAATYSGDKNNLNCLVSTSLCNHCTKNFCGTSAAVASTSAIVALILEANPILSWRDIHHIFAWNCEVAPLIRSQTRWGRNKAGFFYSRDFGFGLIDAGKMVKFAKTMQTVGSMSTCCLCIELSEKNNFNRQQGLEIVIPTNGCSHLPSEINFIEHVQVVVNVEYPQRGAIQIGLESPSKLKVLLMESRRKDQNRRGLQNWILDTVIFWGENPQGKWKIMFFDDIGKEYFKGKVSSIKLIIHGTKKKPLHYMNVRPYYKINFK